MSKYVYFPLPISIDLLQIFLPPGGGSARKLFAVVYTAAQPPLPPKRESTPQARRNYPANKPQQFWYVPEVYKMTKIMEDGKENV